MLKSLLKMVLGIGLGLGLVLIVVALPGLVKTSLGAVSFIPPHQTQLVTSTLFTYQGRLLRNSEYVNDTCSFNFELYPQAEGGAALAEAVVRNVPVDDGYFSAEVDFGDAFNSTDTYLDIQILCVDGPSDFFERFEQRVRLLGGPQALYSRQTLSPLTWDDVEDKPAGFADDIDNVVSYDVDPNTTLITLQDGITFSMAVNAVLNETYVTYQKPLTATNGCANPDEAIQAINEDGSVVCGTTGLTYTTVPTGGIRIQQVRADDRITVTFSLNEDQVQRTITESCDVQQTIAQVNINGTVICETVSQGDVEAIDIAADSGLVPVGLLSGTVVISIAEGGVVRAMLQDDVVSAAKITTGAVITDRIAPNVVEDKQFASRTILIEDLAPCSGAQPLLLFNETTGWGCGNAGTTNAVGGDGINIAANIIAVDNGDGMTFDDEGRLIVDFPPAGTQNGSTSLLARADHNHDDTYIQEPSLLLNQTTDVTGSYTTGFSVTGILNKPLQLTNPISGQILKYDDNSADWVASDFSVRHEIITETLSSASCPFNTQLVGGGCACGAGDIIKSSRPAENENEWECDCLGSAAVTTYAVCVSVQ